MKNWMLIALVCFAPLAADGQRAVPEWREASGLDQRLGESIPLGLEFLDSNEGSLKLESLFHKRPIVLAMGYHECPGLCDVVLNGLIRGLQGIRYSAGEEFDVIFVSINPRETPRDARSKLESCLRRYGRPESRNGWHFLTGDETQIRSLAEAVGFRYYFDEASKQFAHPSGIMVLTSDGKLSRYFYGIEYEPRDLRLAIAEASEQRIGSPVEQLLLLCFHYNPLTGKYGLAVHRVLAASAVLTVLTLAGGIGWMLRRERKAARGIANQISREQPAKPRRASLPMLIAFITPDAASTLASKVDTLFFTLVAVSTAMVLLLGGLIVFFAIKYRRGSPADRGPARISRRNLEIGWTSATLLAFLGIFYWGAALFFNQNRPPVGAMDIHVTGRQWMWEFQYPNGRRSHSDLYVPAGEPVRLVMSSEDVIHSFYVPAFRLKQDVVPGKYVAAWFEATKPGRYRLFCAEYCGAKHAVMGGFVNVLAKEDYERWLGSGAADETLTARGRELFQTYGCQSCHARDALARAPDLTGIYNTLIPLADGGVRRVDEQFLRESILQPLKRVAPGYEPVMPAYEGLISNAELNALIAYIKSLRPPLEGGERKQP